MNKKYVLLAWLLVVGTGVSMIEARGGRGGGRGGRGGRGHGAHRGGRGHAGWHGGAGRGWRGGYGRGGWYGRHYGWWGANRGVWYRNWNPYWYNGAWWGLGWSVYPYYWNTAPLALSLGLVGLANAGRWDSAEERINRRIDALEDQINELKNENRPGQQERIRELQDDVRHLQGYVADVKAYRRTPVQHAEAARRNRNIEPEPSENIHEIMNEEEVY